MPASISFDPVADRYDATRKYPAPVAAQIAAGLLREGRVAQGGSLLELGIGTGRIALPLLASGVNVTGVDIAPLMVERLRAKYDEQRERLRELPWGTLRVEIADMTALPFAAGSFDAVVGVHILHLVPDWRTALDEAMRVLRPGSAFLLGQDVRGDAARNDIHDRWDAIVRELGYLPDPVGAASFSLVVEDLRRRVPDVQVRTLAEWEERHTPRSALEDISERLWSRTWLVPAPIFDESVRRLTAWAAQAYGEALDTPHQARYAFKVAIARQPAD
jgi:SAM-dependent methyltransferase